MDIRYFSIKDGPNKPYLRLPDTVKLWVNWNNTKTLLRLPYGEEIMLHRHDETDEGYEQFYEVYLYDGNRVVRKCFNRSRDCDGLHEYESFSHACILNVLRPKPDSFPNRYSFYPIGESLRDNTAERMGY